MPTPLKRPSLGCVLASLRPPSRAGPLPVQTGFPTSLADLVVKNHVRLRMPRKPQRRPSAVASPVAEHSPAQTVGDMVSPTVQQQDDAIPRRPKRPVLFRFRPELLALGAAMALALLAIWSRDLVAAFTVASLSLLGIESVRSASRRPETAGEPLDSCGGGGGTVSPIREVVGPETDTIMPSCGDTDNGSCGEVFFPLSTDDLGAGGDDPTNPKLKGERSLRKLITRKLHKKPKAKDSSRPARDGEVELAVAGGNASPVQTQSLVPPTEQTLSESSADSSSSSEATVTMEERGGKLPLAAFVPVILAGLVAGKLPATALTLLCLVLSSAARRSPAW